MTDPRSEHLKLLAEIDRRMAEAPDDATRAELAALRSRLNSPDVRDMARDLEKTRPRRDDLVLEFNDPLVPTVLTAGGCLVATAISLFAVVGGFESPIASIGSWTFNLWVVAALAGVISVSLSALSFARSFTVRFDTTGMASRAIGKRWQGLRVGAMTWENIRSLRERAEDKVLEVRAAGEALFEIPMRVANYAVLRQHLENMVTLYGERPAN
ncbi:MAG TPA: hypothetical protein VMF52_14035 [Steroidobacteraceae bacterium]|nr:hypothetical protein [Steroidobacteraceae bacterium]